MLEGLAEKSESTSTLFVFLQPFASPVDASQFSKEIDRIKKIMRESNKYISEYSISEYELIHQNSLMRAGVKESESWQRVDTSNPSNQVQIVEIVGNFISHLEENKRGFFKKV